MWIRIRAVIIEDELRDRVGAEITASHTGAARLAALSKTKRSKRKAATLGISWESNDDMAVRLRIAAIGTRNGPFLKSKRLLTET